MRTIHIVLLTMAIFPAAMAQQSIALSNARWTVSEYSGPNVNDVFYLRTSESGYDTIIDGMVHSKLFGAYDNIPFGALRDNMLGQVFYHRFQDNSEHLLYDFDVSIGDTVHVYNEPYQVDPIVVFGVDTIMVAGIARKRIDLGASDTYWIEGVGGTQGLLTTCACITVSMAYWLDCMSVDGVIQFSVEQSGNVGHCFSPLGMKEAAGPLLRIYPNPSPGHFTIEFPDPLLAGSHYSVYDAIGRLLYQRRLPSGATQESVDLSRYGRGTYMLRVTDPNGVRHERVVLE